MSTHKYPPLCHFCGVAITQQNGAVLRWVPAAPLGGHVGSLIPMGGRVRAGVGMNWCTGLEFEDRYQAYTCTECEKRFANLERDIKLAKDMMETMQECIYNEFRVTARAAQYRDRARRTTGRP